MKEINEEEERNRKNAIPDILSLILSLFLSLSLSLFRFISSLQTHLGLAIYYIYVSASLYISHSLNFFSAHRPPSASLILSLSPIVSLTIFLSPSLSPFHTLSLSLSLFVPHYLSLSIISLALLSPYLSISHCLTVFIVPFRYPRNI